MATCSDDLPDALDWPLPITSFTIIREAMDVFAHIARELHVPNGISLTLRTRDWRGGASKTLKGRSAKIVYSVATALGEKVHPSLAWPAAIRLLAALFLLSEHGGYFKASRWQVEQALNTAALAELDRHMRVIA